ncbi:MAG: hypothetical protein EXX96DRAFT_646017 [Benjaminiella poitrasii]|nr:MAG: hypothetical protein EXX96DRAFT_646017 [Benjaminiella poitrasii]
MPSGKENECVSTTTMPSLSGRGVAPRQVLGQLAGPGCSFSLWDLPTGLSFGVSDKIDEPIEETEEMGFVDESAMVVDDEMLDVAFRLSFLDVADTPVWIEGVVNYSL